MPIIPFKQFGDLDRFFEDDDWYLPSRFRQPAMDVYETDNDVMAKVNVPGIDPEKIDISIKDQFLRISGAMEEKIEEKKKGYWRQEIKKGSFERSVRLPCAVKEEEVEAAYDKGVLEIRMPKSEAAKSSAKKIQIKVK